jgi:hypothetical protein
MLNSGRPMSDSEIALSVLIPYVVAAQAMYRCRGLIAEILQRAWKSRASHHRLHFDVLPNVYIWTMWASYLLWIAEAVFAKRAWGWPGLIAFFLYSAFLRRWVDRISPWPSRSRILQLIQEKIIAGDVGYEGTILLPYVDPPRSA